MRLHVIVEVAVAKDRLNEFKYCLAGSNCKFKDIKDDAYGYNLEIEFTGDHEVGLSVMDLIDKHPHHYLLAYAKDSTKVIPLMEKFIAY